MMTNYPAVKWLEYSFRIVPHKVRQIVDFPLVAVDYMWVNHMGHNMNIGYS